jgi:hypothetical protein
VADRPRPLSESSRDAEVRILQAPQTAWLYATTDSARTPCVLDSGLGILPRVLSLPKPPWSNGRDHINTEVLKGEAIRKDSGPKHDECQPEDMAQDSFGGLLLPFLSCGDLTRVPARIPCDSVLVLIPRR